MKSRYVVALSVIASLFLAGPGAFAQDDPSTIPPPPSADQPHLATPSGDFDPGKLPGFREFLEDQQNAHDKLIVDRFLLGVAIMFAVIAAALLFSLPPKPREQKE